MASIVIVQSDTLKELISIATTLMYADIPPDTNITLKMCNDLESDINDILIDSSYDLSNMADMRKYIADNNLAESYSKLFSEIKKYEYKVSRFRILDKHGTIALDISK